MRETDVAAGTAFRWFRLTRWFRPSCLPLFPGRYVVR